MEDKELIKESLGKKIAGEIILSSHYGKTIRKWRNIFKMSQSELAKGLDIVPSVISDYESERRKNPGIKFISRIIEVFLDFDEHCGARVLKEFSFFESSSESINNEILDIKEFSVPIKVGEFVEITNSDPVVEKEFLDKYIYGYTIIDSVKAITDLKFQEFIKLYGITTERALIFTNIRSGRSPLVAIKVTNLRPAIVILHGPSKIDEIAKRIANAESIPITLNRIDDINKIIKILKDKFN